MQTWSSKAYPLSLSKQTGRHENQETLKDCLGKKKTQENQENNELRNNKICKTLEHT